LRYAYIVLALLVVPAGVYGLVDLNKIFTAPTVIAVLVALSLTSYLLGRTEKCPSCGGRSIDRVSDPR
jgi:hypothetical protein